jgi:pimeloyl-ACP methyl ester carboxylesterase
LTKVNDFTAGVLQSLLVPPRFVTICVAGKRGSGPNAPHVLDLEIKQMDRVRGTCLLRRGVRRDVHGAADPDISKIGKPRHRRRCRLSRGNGDTLNWRVGRDRSLIADGSGLLAVSYRGYEGSTGNPSEDGLHLDAEAAYAFAIDHQIAPDRIVLWGHSLGTGVAVGLAAERTIKALVLEAPYTSIADVAAMNYPYLPVRWLLKDQFHSDWRIGDVTAPVLVFHGDKDDTVPISFGQRLFGLIKSPKCFIRFPLGGHVDLDDGKILASIHDFLARPWRGAAETRGCSAPA